MPRLVEYDSGQDAKSLKQNYNIDINALNWPSRAESLGIAKLRGRDLWNVVGYLVQQENWTQADLKGMDNQTFEAITVNMANNGDAIPSRNPGYYISNPQPSLVDRVANSDWKPSDYAANQAKMEADLAAKEIVYSESLQQSAEAKATVTQDDQYEGIHALTQSVGEKHGLTPSSVEFALNKLLEAGVDQEEAFSIVENQERDFFTDVNSGNLAGADLLDFVTEVGIGDTLIQENNSPIQENNSPIQENNSPIQENNSPTPTPPPGSDDSGMTGRTIAESTQPWKLSDVGLWRDAVDRGEWGNEILAWSHPDKYFAYHYDVKLRHDANGNELLAEAMAHDAWIGAIGNHMPPNDNEMGSFNDRLPEGWHWRGVDYFASGDAFDGRQIGSIVRGTANANTGETNFSNDKGVTSLAETIENKGGNPGGTTGLTNASGGDFTPGAAGNLNIDPSNFTENLHAYINNLNKLSDNFLKPDFKAPDAGVLDNLKTATTDITTQLQTLANNIPALTNAGKTGIGDKLSSLASSTPTALANASSTPTSTSGSGQGSPPYSFTQGNNPVTNMRGLLGEIQSIASDTDPRFTAYKKGITDNLARRKADAMKAVSSRFARRGTAGSSAADMALARIAGDYDEQIGMQEATLGMQEMQRQDQALNTLLGANQALYGMESADTGQSANILAMLAGLQTQQAGAKAGLLGQKTNTFMAPIQPQLAYGQAGNEATALNLEAMASGLTQLTTPEQLNISAKAANMLGGQSQIDDLKTQMTNLTKLLQAQ